MRVRSIYLHGVTKPVEDHVYEDILEKLVGSGATVVVGHDPHADAFVELTGEDPHPSVRARTLPASELTVADTEGLDHDPGDVVAEVTEGTIVQHAMSDQGAMPVFAPQDLAAQEERSVSRLLSFLDEELEQLPTGCRLAPVYQACRSAVEQAWPRGPRPLR